MVFSSATFLFAFLPVVLLLVWLTPPRGRNLVLLWASLLFYCWGEQLYTAVMLLSIGFNYLAGICIGRARGSRTRRGLLGLAVIGNLALLGGFKYAGFGARNLAAIAGLPVEIGSVHLPIGISFFTFQALSYVIDVYRGHSRPQRDPVKLALFISLFPQLIAGPIVRYGDIRDQIDARDLRLQDFAAGVRRFTVGLAKKVLIANTLAVPADHIFGLPATALNPELVWFGAACYAFQIYFDFSGYSDMAIGLGRMFGFRLPENFDLPYTARSITEFWRRWHISLSRWFRDYLYIPLGGSRGAARRTYANLLTVFVLCGLWHGASWSFVVWGLFHGGFLILERVGLGRLLERAPAAVGHVYCMSAVLVGWVFFRAEHLVDAVAMLGAGIGLGAETAAPVLSEFTGPETFAAFAVAALASARWGPVWERLGDDHPRVAGLLTRPLVLTALSSAGLVALLFGSAARLASDTYNPFLYFRF